MNAILEKTSDTRIAIREFNDTLELFYPSSSLPYAMRAPLDSPLSSEHTSNAETLFNSNKLNITAEENRIYCGFGPHCTHRAVITLQNKENVKKTSESIESYFRTADRILVSDINSSNNYLSICELIAKTADYCGCLTDINLPTEYEAMFSKHNTGGIGNSFSAIVALFAICLTFRRISALRGFNFKLIFSGGQPSLAFSAKILGEGIGSIKDLPEYPALEDLDSNGEVTLYSRLVKLTPEDGEELHRLTLVLSLQAEDPSGVLRAPEWKAKTRASLDELELEIPGRF